jgi:hypothetical protein
MLSGKLIRIGDTPVGVFQRNTFYCCEVSSEPFDEFSNDTPAFTLDCAFFERFREKVFSSRGDKLFAVTQNDEILFAAEPVMEKVQFELFGQTGRQLIQIGSGLISVAKYFSSVTNLREILVEMVVRKFFRIHRGTPELPSDKATLFGVDGEALGIIWNGAIFTTGGIEEIEFQNESKLCNFYERKIQFDPCNQVVCNKQTRFNKGCFSAFDGRIAFAGYDENGFYLENLWKKEIDVSSIETSSYESDYLLNVGLWEMALHRTFDSDLVRLIKDVEGTNFDIRKMKRFRWPIVIDGSEIRFFHYRTARYLEMPRSTVEALNSEKKLFHRIEDTMVDSEDNEMFVAAELSLLDRDDLDEALEFLPKDITNLISQFTCDGFVSEVYDEEETYLHDSYQFHRDLHWLVWSIDRDIGFVTFQMLVDTIDEF